MKTSTLFTIAAFIGMIWMAVPAGAQAPQKGQNPEAWREKVKAQKVAFITTKVDLSVEEAQKFWPVYNQVSARRDAAVQAENEAFRKLRQAIKDGDEAQIAEAMKAYTAAVDNKDKFISADVAAYRKVLPEAKVAQVILAEEQFRRDQMARLHQNHKPAKPEKGMGKGPQKGQGAPQNPQAAE
ncbi:MAG: hypothetical protein J6X69_08500 [Bacteroidales bacterium]|nr:hypothetical protein [Bacteroidales bacterium]